MSKMYTQIVDPRKQDIEKTTTVFLNEAMEEWGYKPPLAFLVYNQIRFYEKYGKLNIGYSVASKENLAKQFNVSIDQISQAFNNLTNKYKLGSWIISDKKIYRNVTKVWVSYARQKTKGFDKDQLFIDNEANLLPCNSDAITVEQQEYSTVTPSATSVTTPVSFGRQSNIESNIYNNLTNKENIVSLEEVDKPIRFNGSSAIDKHSQTSYANNTAPFDQPAEFNGESEKQSTRAKFAQANDLVKQLLPRFPQYKKAPKTILNQAKNALEIYAPEAILSTIDAFFDAEWINNKSLANFLSEGVLTRLVSDTPNKEEPKPLYEPGHIQTSEEWIENFRRLNGLDK